jgi:hypothetical protein
VVRNHITCLPARSFINDSTLQQLKCLLCIKREELIGELAKLCELSPVPEETTASRSGETPKQKRFDQE